MSKVQIVERRGRKVAIVPLALWDRMVRAAEDRADQAAVDRVRAQGGDSIPAKVFDRIKFGKENPIKVYRQWRGFNQAQLADKAGIGQGYISQLETGKRRLGRSAAKRIAAALGVDDDLLD